MIDLLLDSFFSSFIIPMGSNGVWFSLLAFSVENLYLQTCLAVAGSTLALMVSYWLGWVLAKEPEKLRITPEGYRRFQHGCRVGIWILLIPWVPLASLFALIVGFSRIGWLQFFLIALASRVIFYAYYLQQAQG